MHDIRKTQILNKSIFHSVLSGYKYDVDEAKCIIKSILNIEFDRYGAFEIARRSRGTPRIANRLLRRVRDYAQVKSNSAVTKEIADGALNMLDVDMRGFDFMDRKLLLTMIEKFDGGPVGVGTIAASIGEETGTIEDVYEPFLLQLGFVKRTAKGRVATRLAFRYLGVEEKNNSPRLFE